MMCDTAEEALVIKKARAKFLKYTLEIEGVDHQVLKEALAKDELYVAIRKKHKELVEKIQKEKERIDHKEKQQKNKKAKPSNEEDPNKKKQKQRKLGLKRSEFEIK